MTKNDLLNLVKQVIREEYDEPHLEKQNYYPEKAEFDYSMLKDIEQDLGLVIRDMEKHIKPVFLRSDVSLSEYAYTLRAIQNMKMRLKTALERAIK